MTNIGLWTLEVDSDFVWLVQATLASITSQHDKGGMKRKESASPKRKSQKQTIRDRGAADPHSEQLITDLENQANHSCLECAWTQADE